MLKRQNDTSKQPLGRLNISLAKIDACMSLMAKASPDQVQKLAAEGVAAVAEAQAAYAELCDLVRKF